MTASLNLPLILVAALLAVASPGPATLAIANASMNSGRRVGLALASGVSLGSLIWSVSAAFGLAAAMLANTWMIETIRYFGATYLMYLAFRSARSSLRSVQQTPAKGHSQHSKSAFGRGLALHLTNPKAILFFGALYAIGIPHGVTTFELLIVILAVSLQSTIVFHLYAWMFSSPKVTAGYLKLRRGFEAIFALVFAGASLRILTAELQ